MAKVINNRIYLECEIDADGAYFKEIHEVIKLGLDKHVLIWDQSKQEVKNTDKEVFDVHMSMNKINSEGIKIFDRNICIELVKKNLVRTNFIQFGCWKSELSVINEIKSVCEIIWTEEYGEQIEFFAVLNESVEEYLFSNYLDSDGNFKWFNLGLYISDNKESLIFSMSHCGEEIYMFNLNAEEVEKMIFTVEYNDVYVRINRHQLYEHYEKCDIDTIVSEL